MTGVQTCALPIFDAFVRYPAPLYFNVSIDAATAPTYTRIRGWDFERLLRHIETYVTAFRSRSALTKTTLSYVICASNLHETGAVVRLAARLGRRARAVAMRDTDQDLTSVILVRADGDIRTVDDFRGRRVAVGADDSPQATILPLLHLAERGLTPGVDFEVVVHDVLAGKHGDHVGGERDAVRALTAGSVDAACVLDANALGFVRDGTAREGALRTVAETAPYDHCNFTALDGVDAAKLARFTELLFGMRYDDPAVRPLMDLEGLKQWRPGRLDGYAPLGRAVDRFHTLDAWLDAVTARLS